MSIAVSMVAVPLVRSELQSFRLAHPVVDASSRFEVTVFAGLTAAALVLWLLVLPLEAALYAGGI